MCIHIYIYMYTHVSIHLSLYIYIYIHTCVHIYIYIYIHTYIRNILHAQILYRHIYNIADGAFPVPAGRRARRSCRSWQSHRLVFVCTLFVSCIFLFTAEPRTTKFEGVRPNQTLHFKCRNSKVHGEFPRNVRLRDS